jgi:hypothetical protein
MSSLRVRSLEILGGMLPIPTRSYSGCKEIHDGFIIRPFSKPHHIATAFLRVFFPGTARQGRCAEAIPICGEEIAHLHRTCGAPQVQVSPPSAVRNDTIVLTYQSTLRKP